MTLAHLVPLGVICELTSAANKCARLARCAAREGDELAAFTAALYALRLRKRVLEVLGAIHAIEEFENDKWGQHEAA